MSNKITFAAIAVVLTALSVPASAQSYFYPATDHQSNHTAGRSRVNVPADAFGSASERAGTSFGRQGDIVSGSKLVGRDPDVNVRAEILRDGINAGKY
jgi:hypothetical protein